METPVLVTRGDNGIVTLMLNRSETRNPISDTDMVEALLHALHALDDDIDVRVVILTGAGSAFCAGGNLKKMGKKDGPNDPPVSVRRMLKRDIQRIPLAFEALEVPVIAAVNGPAIGAGCDLALMCDLRIASEKAVFAESFVKVGLVPGDGGAWLLPRVIGFAKACEMALTGDSVDAAEALRIGLVTQVVPPDQLLTAAHGLAERIAANPPHVVRMTRRLLREAQALSLPAMLELAAGMQGVAHATADHREAVAAILEKRQPVFKGE